MFFKKQERSVSFYSVDGLDSWDSPTETFLFDVSAIVSMTSVSISGEELENHGSSNVRIFINKANKDLFVNVKNNDEVEIQGVRFQISKIDSRGVLPTHYPIRIEGVRKV